LSNVAELPDLAGDVRDRAVPPPYEEVSRRVRARRVRGAAGTAAAAVAVVAVLAVWQSVATTAEPSRPQPATQGPVPPTDESLWRAVVDGTDSHPFETEGTDDGSIAVVWRALEPGAPTFALVIREADGSVHGMRLEDPVSLTPVPGGWVGMDGPRGHLIGSDGSWTDLDETAARSPRAGDVVVSGQYSSWLYSPDDHTLAALPELSGAADGYVTPDGVLAVCESPGPGHVWVTMRQVHSEWTAGDSCVMAGRGDMVSAVGLGDEPDGSIPLMGLLVTGRDGAIVGGDFMQMSGVTSVVVTPSGATLVTDAGTGDAFILSADRRRLVEPDRKVGEAFVAGDRLYVSSYGFMNGPLFFSEDDGRTWTETTLPGNESKQD
jgi:hypothetical protein